MSINICAIAENEESKMSDWLEGLIVERDELNQKLARLERFLKSDDFNNLDLTNRVMLSLQAKIMFLYLEILDQRIQLNYKGNA